MCVCQREREERERVCVKKEGVEGVRVCVYHSYQCDVYYVRIFIIREPSCIREQVVKNIKNIKDSHIK